MLRLNRPPKPSVPPADAILASQDTEQPAEILLTELVTFLYASNLTIARRSTALRTAEAEAPMNVCPPPPPLHNAYGFREGYRDWPRVLERAGRSGH